MFNVGDRVESAKDKKIGIIKRTVTYAVIEFDDGVILTRSMDRLTAVEGGEAS